MKTVNTYYRSKGEFESFLKLNNFKIDDEYLVQVFTGIVNKSYIESLLKDIEFILPNAVIIGSTTDGEILDTVVSTTQTVVSVSKFYKTKINASYIKYNNEPIYEQSRKLAQSICDESSKLIISFADGLNTDGEQYLKGISSLCSKLYVAGGLSGDNATFKQSFVFINGKVIDKGAVAVSLSGELNIHTDFSFDWEPIGKELIITKVVDNVVYTIDNKSAYDTYKYYLGDEVAQRLPAIGIEFPLIIQRNGVNIARAVTGILEDGALRFAGDLVKGDIVRFGYGNSHLILENSIKIVDKLIKKPIESIFVYSCMARRRFLNNMISRELDPLSALAPMCGFFTYGEFFTSTNSKELLNQTMTVLVLSESDRLMEKHNFNMNYANDDLYTISSKALSHLINVTSLELEEINSQQYKLISSQSKMALMGDMIANIAHQWRQPLSTISTAITAIKLQRDIGVLKDSFFDKSTDKILDNVDFLADTITTFRNFLKEDKEVHVVVVQDIIKQALLIVGSTLQDYHIDIIQNIDYKEEYKIKIAGQELVQVLINIIYNAKDALIENKQKVRQIKIKCKDENSYISIIISDNAGGIPFNIMNKIFDPYFTTKGEEKGTGLGLHMCKSIVEKNMEGEISVKNKKRGAAFYIKLPKYIDYD